MTCPQDHVPKKDRIAAKEYKERKKTEPQMDADLRRFRSERRSRPSMEIGALDADVFCSLLSLGIDPTSSEKPARREKLNAEDYADSPKKDALI